MSSIIVGAEFKYKGGIYVILSALSKNAYVGKAMKLQHRFSAHKRNMINRRVDINEIYGCDNEIFIFKPVFEIPEEGFNYKAFIYEELFIEAFRRRGFHLYNKGVSRFHDMSENDFNWIARNTGVEKTIISLPELKKGVNCLFGRSFGRDTASPTIKDMEKIAKVLGVKFVARFEFGDGIVI